MKTQLINVLEFFEFVKKADLLVGVSLIIAIITIGIVFNEDRNEIAQSIIAIIKSSGRLFDFVIAKDMLLSMSFFALLGANIYIFQLKYDSVFELLTFPIMYLWKYFKMYENAMKDKNNKPIFKIGGSFVLTNLKLVIVYVLFVHELPTTLLTWLKYNEVYEISAIVNVDNLLFLIKVALLSTILSSVLTVLTIKSVNFSRCHSNYISVGIKYNAIFNIEDNMELYKRLHKINKSVEVKCLSLVEKSEIMYRLAQLSHVDIYELEDRLELVCTAYHNLCSTDDKEEVFEFIRFLFNIIENRSRLYALLNELGNSNMRHVASQFNLAKMFVQNKLWMFDQEIKEAKIEEVIRLQIKSNDIEESLFELDYIDRIELHEKQSLLLQKRTLIENVMHKYQKCGESLDSNVNKLIEISKEIDEHLKEDSNRLLEFKIINDLLGCFSCSIDNLVIFIKSGNLKYSIYLYKGSTGDELEKLILTSKSIVLE